MSRPLWRFYLRSYTGSLGEILISVAAAILQSFLLLPMAWLVGYAFDQVLPRQDVRQIVLLGAAIVALQLVNLGVQLWARRRIVQVTKRATERLRVSLLARLFAVSRQFHSEQDWGLLHARFVHDTDRVDRFNETIIGSLLPSVITAAAICVMLLTLNPLLFLALTIMAPLLLLSSKLISQRMRRQIIATERATKRFAQGTRFLLEMMDLIRIQTAEAQETARQRALIADLRAQGVKVQTLRTLNSGVNETVIVLASVAILIVGGRAVAHDTMTVGQLLSFYTGLVLVRPYFQSIALSWPYWIEGLVALQSLAELEDTQIDAPYHGAALLDFQGEIRLEGVQFHYQQAPTLHNISFTLPRGGLIGLIGPNGSGKSTIVNLILGFYRPQAGQLLADGQPYADLDLLALRQRMAVVMQTPILFPGTVWDNLIYGLPQAGQAEVYAAAQEAGAHALILGLPQGYQTLVGEKGLLLSGGQRQRIALTRALLRQPRLLILDEPTNHLDAEAVLDLLDLLTQRRERPTTLVISHDLRLARCMDQVVLLEAGEVLAAGPAAEVLPSLAPEAAGKFQKSGS